MATTWHPRAWAESATCTGRTAFPETLFTIRTSPAASALAAHREVGQLSSCAPCSARCSAATAPARGDAAVLVKVQCEPQVAQQK